MIQFRPYQSQIIREGSDILWKHGFLYLAMEVRTGKTLTALGICQRMGARNVLFITKKKAISSIESDVHTLDADFNCITINYESLHKVPKVGWDIIICDEAHSMGAFPKPSKRAKQVREMIAKNKSCCVILMSGTPTPESRSQIYHQLYGIPGNPFSKYKNFYRFADDYVSVRQRKINGHMIADYSHGLNSIMTAIDPYTITYSQREAGFKGTIKENVLYVTMAPVIYKVADQLKKDLVVQGEGEVILGDTPVKLMTKLHQLYSGTVKFESGNAVVLDRSKAEFIKKHFEGKKIGIFYKFKAELRALKEVFGDTLCETLDEFNSTDKHIALQVVSGREGISLRKADFIVYYNIDFSATSYWQSRDRRTTKDRPDNQVYWVFSKGGIEDSVYKAVQAKKTFTSQYFKKNYLT
jgi:hypothetical protein